MAFKNKNKTRNESNYKITIDQLHKTMSQNFIEEFKSLKSLNEEKNDLEIEINEIKKTIKENDEIGEIIIKTNNDEDIIVPVYASETVEKVNFFKSLFMSFNYMIWGDV